MNRLNFKALEEFANTQVAVFHNNKLQSLKQLNLKKILKRKNPYLYKAKNLNVASDLVESVLDAYLSSSEEKLFGDFLEELALFIAEKTCGARKSSANGIDLEFLNKNIHYLVSIKSGPNWGNSAQQREQEQNFRQAIQILKQSSMSKHVEPVLGICYGKVKTSRVRNYLKVVGQNFWYLISEEEELYKDIIEPIGYNAKMHNQAFLAEKDRIANTLTHEFLDEFCADGLIDWAKLVQFNSGNLDIKNWYEDK